MNSGLSNEIEEGDVVQFYDSDLARKENDASGTDPKFYPCGVVIKRYITPIMELEGWAPFGGDDVVDVRLSDGRVSLGHFTAGVKLISKAITL